MGISWGALAGAFLAPFLYGLYSRKVTKSSVWVCFALGISIMIFSLTYKLCGWRFLRATLSSGETLDFGNAVIAGSISMLAGLAIVPLVSLLTYRHEVKKGILDVKNVDACFDCFKNKVLVPVKESLGEDDAEK
jgi:SSS family solute:Na+ symporter